MIMAVLAFDTSTDTMSVAVGRTTGGASRIWQHSAAGGAQASATLIPVIRALMAQAGLGFGELDAIAFGRGPGAFTGLRTACAVAQGLAFGAHVPGGGAPVPVLAIDSLLALAEEARHQHAPDAVPLQVLALLDARMDEIYAATYAFDGAGWSERQPPGLDRPERLVLAAGWHDGQGLLAGNVFAAYGERLVLGRGAPRVAALPTATAMLRLAPRLLAGGLGTSAELALPVYIRDKVAQTTSERAAARANAESSR